MRLTVALALLCSTVMVFNASGQTAESKEARDARMRWWRNARFGMFVHWGLYSGLAGTWDGKPVGTKGGMEWIQQRVKADTDTYAQRAIPLFKPMPGFAKEWVKLAKAAGCRYIVLTTKHHDGFALHDSKVSEYDAGSVLGRDLIKEFTDAARAEGLRIGFYHSVIDWHHDQYAYALSKQLPHPLKGQPYPNGERDHSVYLKYLHAQVDELVSNYGPIDVLWWDYSSQDFEGETAWRAFELMTSVRARQPAVIMNNRLFRNPASGWKSMGTDGFTLSIDNKYGDFITPEQHIPSTGMPGLDFEVCMTLNTTWGYSAHDHNWKSDETLIRNLIDIASKGGNYLLNIGPKADGSLTAETLAAFRAIGKWMSVNNESIYETTSSPFPYLSWGRATMRTAGPGTTLYLHVFDWPADGILKVPMKADIASAIMLSVPETKVAFETVGAHTVLRLPQNAPDKIATVIKLDLRSAPEVDMSIQPPAAK